MATNENGGLFGATAGTAAAAAADAAPTSKRQKVNDKDKRMMLRPWDTAAAQLLNPYGRSNMLSQMSQAELWRATAEGSAKARFHSELAATAESGGPYRVGVGLSRMVEPILEAIQELRKRDMGKLIVEAHLQAAMTEADTLEPYLKILHAGKGAPSANDTTSSGFGRARKDKAKQKDTPKYTQEQIEDAAKYFHKWL